MPHRLPISVGILSWESNRTIRATLNSYRQNGLWDTVAESRILFQEARRKDLKLALEHGIEAIAETANIGISNAFRALAERSTQPLTILLEHDWLLVEGVESVRRHLSAAVSLVESRSISCVRLRHRKEYGYPHFSIDRYKGKELEFFDPWIELPHPHLLDALHWIDRPDERWPDKIRREGDFFVSSSRYANWTNNPCLYRTDFLLECLNKFPGSGISLERDISYWWARQDFQVAQGEGLFKHDDPEKYQPTFLERVARKVGLRHR